MKSDSSISSAGSEVSGMVLSSAEATNASGPTTSTSMPTKSTQPDSGKPTIIQATLGESMQRRYPTTISFVQDFHASRFRLPGKGMVSRTLVERFSSRYAELRSLSDLACYSWKTLRVSQNRERVFIIGHSRNGGSKPIFPITEAGGVADQGAGEEGEYSTAIDA